jgi:hypothetical protein
MCFDFCRLYLFSLPSHHSSVWVLLVISLFLTNKVSLVRACLPILMIGEVSWDPKKDQHGPLSIYSSLRNSIYQKSVKKRREKKWGKADNRLKALAMVSNQYLCIRTWT